MQGLCYDTLTGGGRGRADAGDIETGQFNPTAKLALVLCIALDKKFEELFYFD